MVDWRLAERVAEAVAGGDGAGPPLAGGVDLDAMATRACEHVSAYARLEPAVPPPRWSRGAQGWPARTSRPWAGRSSPARAPGQRPCSRRRRAHRGRGGRDRRPSGRNVLGQYDSLLDAERPPRLLLVAPNLRRPLAPSNRRGRWSGSSSMRSPMPCSSPASRGTRAPGLLLLELLSSVKVEVDPTRSAPAQGRTCARPGPVVVCR
jgi:hypothetical protein